MNTNQKGTGRGIGWYVIVIFVALATVALLFGPGKDGKTQQVTYTEMRSDLKNHAVTEMVIGASGVEYVKTDGSRCICTLTDKEYFTQDLGEEITAQQNAGTLKVQYYAQNSSIWMSILPYVVLLVLFGVFWFYLFNRQAGGGGAVNFGRSPAKMANPAEGKRVTFRDVAGADEEKADLEEVVDFLKNPQKYMSLGARIPKGVLLVGPPGTGKTLIAKAVAGEAGVPFFSISGSDFVELYVGVGASRVRSLFDQAVKHAPAIVFIDEIDAVGRQRGTGLGGGHDEREQTLNQLLVEMDGFGNNAGVIVMAATNRADILDPALLRPGRFDRQIYIGVPDIKGRVEILKVHARKKPFEDDVSFDAIARSTVGFTGADLENLLNEAALLAARRGKHKIGLKDIDDAFLKVIMGNEKKSRVMTEKERRLTAYHEAGHALTSRVLPTQDPVQQVSIVPRGRAGGFTLNMPVEDKYYNTKQEMEEEVVVLLGGRVAEKLIIGDISTGASNDIQRASDIARNMVTKFGMSDKLGPIDFSASHDEVFLGRDFANTNHLSEETASLIDEEIKSIISAAYARCEQILTDNLEILHRLAAFLLEHETMDNAQLEAIYNGETPPAEITAQPLAQKQEGDLSAREAMAQAAAEEAAKAAEAAAAQSEEVPRDKAE